MAHFKQLLLTLLVLLGLGQTLEVRADDFTYNAGNYTCMIVGVDKVRFTLPTGNTKGVNDGVQEGYVYVAADGGPEEVLLSWHCDKYSQVDDGCKIKAFKDGTFTLVGKVQGGNKTFTIANGEISYKLDHNDDNSDHYTTTVDWQVPYSMRGKKLKLLVWAHVNWSAVGDWHVPSHDKHRLMLEWDCPPAPDVNITLNDPMLSYDRSEINKIMMTYSVTASKIVWLKLHYTDALTGKDYTQDMPTKNLVGFAYLPADRPWKNIYMTAKVLNTEKKEVELPAPEESAWLKTKMLHHPKNFSATLNKKGEVLLKWTVDEPKEEDIESGDFFEIQRNLTGSTDTNSPNWTTISMEIPFEQGKKDYSFLDNTLMDQYQGKPASYRIRRSTTTMWSWGPGSGYMMYQSPSILVLPQIENATVQRNGTWNEESHPVKFNFNFGTSHDSQGRVFIHNEEEWNAFSQNYTSKSELAANCVFMISDENGWKLFNKILYNYPNTNAILACDLEVSTPITNSYRGTFDGMGHTLTINTDAAPFAVITNATIKNLIVAGTVNSKNSFASSLIGEISSYSTVNIERCVIISTISLSKSGDTSSGGFVGIMKRSAYINFKDCAFHGKLQGEHCNANGGFVGVALENTTINFENCFFDPKELPSDMTNCATFVRADKTANVIFNDKCYYTRVYNPDKNFAQGKNAANMSVESLLAVYGKGWTEYDNTVAPIITTEDEHMAVAVWDPRAQLLMRVNMKGENSTASEIVDLSDNDDALNKNQFTYDLPRKCVEYNFDLIIRRNKSKMNIFGTGKDGVYPDTLVVKVAKIDKGNLANYRYMNLASIDSLRTTTKQSSVVLNWWTSGGESDYFRVLRRKHTSTPNAEWPDTIASNIRQNFWEDKKVKVQQAYDYMVESVTQCEGVHVVKSEIKAGECEPTAMICGYVRMADGTSMAGVEVIIEPVDEISKSLNNAQYKVKTDEAGYFEQKGLKYRGTGQFSVHVHVTGDGKSYTGGGTVVFNSDTNMLADYNFYQDNYVVYSGNVYYADTSIPVSGVSFKLDGNLMYDGNKKVIETDNQGEFVLSIPYGAHSVQAVKEGHILADDGYLLNPDDVEDKRLYNFTRNVPMAHIWDSTTVVLRGRVVGGDIEGSKPLGNSLSKNNLGDSLKIVMQLEGDNTSWLIRNPKDDTVKSKDYAVAFGKENAKGERPDTTIVNVKRHSLTIRPDKKTGEYELKIHPAKYKVIEVSAQGYPTLFQQGKVGETIDLAFKVQGDTCEYSRIYHSVPTVEVTQFNPGNEPYYGVKKLKAIDNIGNEEWVNLFYYKYVYPNDDTTQQPTDSIGQYSLGYPVFMAGSAYGWMLQACEKYYKNNKTTYEPDIVKLNGGEITIKNYLIGTNDNDLSKTIKLDETGGASYIFTPQNTTFTLENDMALKSVSITLVYDSCFYDVKPFNGNMLKGYVMASKPKPDGRKAIVSGTPMLFDILRDPPGSGSSAYLEEGSKLSYGYSADLSGALGFKVKSSIGSGAETYHGGIAAPNGIGEEAGTMTHVKNQDGVNLSFKTNFGFSWSYSYNMDVTERIQTKTGAKWIGGKADLFIGATENIIVQDAMAVRVIPESMYQLVKTHEGGTFEVKDKDGNVATLKVPIGTTKVLAKGADGTGKPVYLVRDEVMQVSPVVKSTFVHSQNYIENELLPDLMKIRNSLLLPKGTSEADAKKLANKQGYATYISNVDIKDEKFGLDYTPVFPDGKLAGDSIMALNEEMAAWVGILAKNEQEKLSVLSTNLVKRYDFDGGMSSIQYSESFSTSESLSRYLRYPLISGTGNLASGTEGILPPLFAALENLMASKQGQINTDTHWKDYDSDGYPYTMEVNVSGECVSIKRGLIAEANFVDKYSTTESHSKKTGFTLSAASKSSLTVDVYRTAGRYTIDPNANPFNKFTLEMLDDIRNGKLTPNALNYLPTDAKVYSNFVFRTIGGVTCQPYEGQRATKWYQPGTVLDVATIPADNPRIWIEEPVQTNVPSDQPARFVLHIANETNYPDRATMVFNYFLPAGCNPKGAKICVDGAPLTGTGANIVLYPVVDNTGKVNVFTKEITVYPSEDFDYENLGISLMDPEDAQRVFTANFSAHFIPSAGDVKVSTPSDHWVINTESPYDGKQKAWYMPVRIEGFNVNGRGFDHIELQYKLTTQGEKDWVSVCSYYANDSLRAKASGVTDTIPSNGIIVAPFYGEKDPVEQYYDLRAVVYARYAGGFLTNSSPILTGIKDTRLPRLFGTPEPINSILGIGDDIKLEFSEPIAGNYLSKINNFEVLGTPVNTNVSTSTSVTFDGVNSYAATFANRNLKGKNFTVDVMVNPAADKGDMAVFTHGGPEKGFTFGITADRHLSATVQGTTVVSDEVVKFNNLLHQIAYALEQGPDQMTIHFYDGSQKIGTKTIQGVYESYSPFYVGFSHNDDQWYKGDMLELRFWNRVLTGNDLADYGGKTLTGYEKGLLDYYRLNEGEGNFCYDRASGSLDLTLIGHSWKRPAGISLKMDGKNGVRLNTKQKFNRSKNHDYTLMMWFRTENENATLLSNGEANREQEDQINIGINNGDLTVRSSGFEISTDNVILPGEWHHFAMTVSRNRNVANIYLDKKLVETFAADSLSGIQGDYIALGATYVDEETPTKTLTGNIDEVGMFESVLPTNLLTEYTTNVPVGTMKSLMFYLDFGRSEHLDNNTMRLQPTGISIKRYVDSQGKTLERRDTLLAEIDESLVDRSKYAPMKSVSQMENLKYNYVAKNNELLIDLEEPDFTIEKTNAYITVKEIPDMQGNLMASPITMNVYIYRNPLRWSEKKVTAQIDYGHGYSFDMVVKNLSGQTQNYSITDLPIWIKASQTSGAIEALGEQTITFEVSPYINIGTYNELISLNGGNNMYEPLPITLTVRGAQPEWTVSEDVKKFNQTMMMVARVKIDGMVTHSAKDLLGVFDKKGQTLGTAHIEVDNTANANEALAFLTIYGYTNDDGTKPDLYFKFFQASSGEVFNVEPHDKKVITFQKDAIIGSASAPIILENNFFKVHRIALKQGWNWVSFNVVPEKKDMTVGDFLNRAATWEPGDIITSVNGTQVQQWVYREVESKKSGNQRTYKWDDEDQPINIHPSLMYRIYSSNDKSAYFEGYPTFNEITVRKGWNRIAYLSTINLPIAQALTEYTEQAQEGDVIKSQDGFAVATRAGSTLVWKGTLQFMETGKGYMLRRMADEEAKFTYPLYWSDNRYSGSSNASAPLRDTFTSTTMNIVASVEDVETEAGDILVVYRGAERLAEAVADEEQIFYLNIGSDAKSDETLTFVLERDENVVAATSSKFRYKENLVLGTPDKPTAINFTAVEPNSLNDGKWYTVSGIQLPKAPNKTGIYIHNGKVKYINK